VPRDRDAPTVLCEDLVRVYISGTGETPALRGIDLTFGAGTVTAVAGPSGSGKSSLLRLLAARDRPSAGKLELLGHDLGSAPDRTVRDLRRRHVSYVDQRSARGLFPHLTAAEQVRQVASLRGTPQCDVEATLESVGLAQLSNHRPAQTSGGEQQRLAVALALVSAPAIVVADEPTAELDTANAAIVLAALRRAAGAGSTVVLSTHSEQALDVADRVIRLRHGVLSSEQLLRGEHWAVIDATGRVQLPPEALAAFPDGRARVELTGDGVVLRPPGAS
jgi:ABC-type lipoprotein export system ATPase subunit